MAQLLRELAVLPVDRGLILSTRMAAHSCLQLQFRPGNLIPHTCGQNTNAYKIKF